MTDRPPNVLLSRLYRNKAKDGSTYFSGYMGMTRVALLKSKDNAPDGSEIWNLLISQAPPKDKPAEASNGTAPRSGAAYTPKVNDDEIPF